MLSEILVGIAIASLGFLAAVAKTQWSGRLRVRRIRSNEQPEWDGFIEIYQQCFPDSEHGPEYTADDWDDFLGDGEFEPPVAVENFLYVGMVNSGVIGFIVGHYYPETTKAIISYIGAKPGIKSKEKHVTRFLVLQTLNLLKKLDCKMVLFETEMDARHPGKSKRLRLFRGLVNNSKKGMFRNAVGSGKSPEFFTLNYNFPQPAVKIEKIGRHEKRIMELSIVFLDGTSRDEGIDRETMRDILRWLLIYCYGDVYSIHDDDCVSYRNYLSEYYDQLETKLEENTGYRK